MIKAVAGKKILLGLDKTNVKRLKQGQPIFIKGSDIGLEKDIYILYGNSLKDIQKECNLPSSH